MMIYINFYFENLSCSDHKIQGDFSAPDYGVSCSFLYKRDTEECTIWNNNKAVEEIEPLPIYWLLRKLEKNGKLNKSESKVSY